MASAGDIARQRVPVFRPGDRVGEASDRADLAGWDMGVVLDEDGALIGLLTADELGGDPEATVRDVMRGDPEVARAEEDLDQVAGRMRERGQDRIPVMGDEGLVGVLFLADAEGRAAEAAEDGRP